MEVLRVVRARGDHVNGHCRRLVAAGRRPGLVGVRAAILSIAALGAASLAPAADAQRAPLGRATADRWTVRSREHVDLWLHGFALLSDDSSQVPLFRRDYRDLLIVERNKANVASDLDANREALQRRLRAGPGLVNAQFLALSFGSWAEMESALQYFLRAEGDPRAAPNREAAQEIAFIAGAFRTREDREFARMFLNALQSERQRFFHAWWLAETRRRDRAFTAVDSLWQRVWRPRLQRFLDHTKQGDGEVLLSLALEGEGRTLTGGPRRNAIAVGFPDSPERAIEAIYALLHEIVGPVTSASVADHTTPAEKRSGEADRLQAAALVRGGALVARRLGTDLADGYARYYLRLGGADEAPGGDPMAALARAFPLPRALIESIDRQIAVSFGGI
jgi:hypothetical protein